MSHSTFFTGALYARMSDDLQNVSTLPEVLTIEHPD